MNQSSECVIRDIQGFSWNGSITPCLCLAWSSKVDTFDSVFIVFHLSLALSLFIMVLVRMGVVVESSYLVCWSRLQHLKQARIPKIERWDAFATFQKKEWCATIGDLDHLWRCNGSKWKNRYLNLISTRDVDMLEAQLLQFLMSRHV